MNIIDKSKQLVYFKQHPEAALRYYPIVKLIHKKRLANSKILEIGSGSIGIAPYLKKKVTGVDLDFSEGNHSLLKQVKGSALKLPFPKKHFDLAILSDVLEHISPKDRAKAIDEAIRVSKKGVIISGPFGEEAFKQDQKLANYSKQKLGDTHHFFEEHLKYGLPDIDQITKLANQNKRVHSVERIGNFLNLKTREWLMKRFLAKSKIGYYFYLKGLMPTVSLLKHFNKAPTYRKVIYLNVK